MFQATLRKNCVAAVISRCAIFHLPFQILSSVTKCAIGSRLVKKMTDAIAEGDTVRLKSGGPLMTATNVTGDNITCEWFDRQDQAQSRTFKALALVKSPVSQSDNGS
jgi:uncharacterized protein YodC (DUF2158 family)